MASSVRAITQETFDTVVKENIEDFEMDELEAINDAVEQFKSQVMTWFCKSYCSDYTDVCKIYYKG